MWFVALAARMHFSIAYMLRAETRELFTRALLPAQQMALACFRFARDAVIVADALSKA